MRNLSFYLLLITSLLVACSSESDDPVPVDVNVDAELGGVAAKINSDIDWESNSDKSGAVIADGTISIAAVADDGSSLALLVTGETEGTYEIVSEITNNPIVTSAAFNPADLSFNNPSFTSVSVSNSTSGTIVIQEIADESVTGTFSLKLARFVNGSEEFMTISGSFNKVKFDSEDTNPPAGGATNAFAAKIDGVDYNPQVVSGVATGSKLVLNFSNGASNAIGINLPDDIEAGVYDFGTFGSAISATYIEGTTIYSSFSGGGSINISLHDIANKRIEATFSFEGEEWPVGTGTVSITDGSFEVTYN